MVNMAQRSFFNSLSGLMFTVFLCFSADDFRCQNKQLATESAELEMSGPLAPTHTLTHTEHREWGPL